MTKKVIRGTGDRKQQIVVSSTGHPAAFRKLRCPKCKLGYCVASNQDPEVYACERCGHSFRTRKL